MPSNNEIRRGWLLILAACAGVTCSSVVLPFYTLGAQGFDEGAEFHWTRAAIQSAAAFSSGLGAISAPVIGAIIDRHGARWIALFGLLGLSVAFLLASQMDGHLWLLYAAYTSMAVLGAGTVPVTWTRAIATSFFDRRGLALGLTLTGTGISAVLAPLYAVWLVEHVGWRGAYVGLGLLPVIVAGPLVYRGFKPVEPRLTRPTADPEDVSAVAGLSLREAMSGRRFWTLLLSVLAIYLAVSGIIPNLIPLLTDNGMAPSSAAQVQSFYGIAVIGGRVLIGYLIDRYWAPGVAAIALSLPVLGTFILAGPVNMVAAACAAILVGLAAGAELDLLSYLAARYFGMRHYAKIYAVLYAALAVAAGSAPYLFARIYDTTKSYRLAFFAAGGSFLFGALILLTLGPYPRFAQRSTPRAEV
jgi:MFS transporter, OFA family, oxalate/formate antiporter